MENLVSFSTENGLIVGFCIGTGVYLFAWFVRQPYRIFRWISGVGIGK